MIANCQETFHAVLTVVGKCQLNTNCSHCRLMLIISVARIVNTSTHSEPLNESQNRTKQVLLRTMQF